MCVWCVLCRIYIYMYIVYACAGVCVLPMSSLDDNKFGGDSCGSGAFPADRWSCTHTGTLGASDAAP